MWNLKKFGEGMDTSLYNLPTITSNAWGMNHESEVKASYVNNGGTVLETSHLINVSLYSYINDIIW